MQQEDSGGVLKATYQEDVFKDLCRTVHLAQNENHLIVYELFELSQVACHVHFQLSSNLRNKSREETNLQQLI